MRRTALAGAVLAALAAPAAAQQQVAVSELRGMSLADVLEVDISTGTQKFLRQAPAIAYVITADDIDRLGARNVLEALEAVPGISVIYQGAVTNAPLVDMRGSFTSRGGHVLFLRDGKPLRTLGNNTMPEIFRLPVQMVERIEIARGPGASVHGADALVGTINIVTKKKAREAGIAAGTPEYRAGWGAVSGQAGGLEWSIDASHSRNVDDAATRTVNPSRQFTQRWQHVYDDVDLRLRAGGFHADVWALNYDKEESGDPRNPAPRTIVGTGHRHFELGYEGDVAATTRFGASATYTRFRGQRLGELTPPGAPAAAPKNAEVRTTVEATLTETRFAGHRLRLAAGAFRERRIELIAPVRPPGAPVPSTDYRYNRYVGLQDEWGFARNWELTLGLRLDHFSDYGTIRNPRAGLVWTVNPQLTTKLLVGEAFRAPIYNDPGIAGRTAEGMRNVELAFDYRPADAWSVVLSVFDYRARDILEPAGGGATAVLSREGRGGELLVGWQPHRDWRLDAGFAYADVTDRATGRRVPLSTRESAKVALNWQPAAAWNVNLRWEGYFDRVRAPNAALPPLDDYGVGHLTVRYDVMPRLTAALVVHNIAGKRAWVPYVAGAAQDVRLLERSTFAQLEYRF